jgi:tellurium resistance protein TerD
MSVSLAKGGRVNLQKDNPALVVVNVGLGWDTNRYSGSAAFDLDAAAFLLGANGKITQEKDFVFYGNLTHPSGAVVHTGDNLTGEGDGDDEVIKFDLSKIPTGIEKVAVTVTIHEATQRNQNFGQVDNAFVRIVDAATGTELARYDLTEDYSSVTAMVMGELYKKDGQWSFKAIGEGFSGGLVELCANYGVEVK